MTSGLRYLSGVGVVAVGGALVTALVDDSARATVGWGIGVGLVLQTPLGWWAVRSLGTYRFMAMWGVGMLVRLGAVAVAALVTMPVLGARAGAMLVALVGVLVALLLVEGLTALREHEREDQR